MHYLFLLSSDNLPLARQEIMSLAGKEECKVHDNLLVMESEPIPLHRLAYTHKVFELLFVAKKKYIHQEVGSFAWPSVIAGDYALRFIHSEHGEEQQIASKIWSSLSQPKVNLDNPSIEIFFLFMDFKVYVARLLWSNPKEFLQRKPHLRPVLYPTSLSPKLARGLVNLSGARVGDTLLDPFCGTGGILLEAGMIGIHGVGYDIDPRMEANCKMTLKYYGVDAEIEHRDALTNARSFEYVVTDLPYGMGGKGTKDTMLLLYPKFIASLKSYLTKRAVIVFPHYADVEKLMENQFQIKHQFSSYVHKSLTKKIVVVENGVEGAISSLQTS